jgi:Family of unknown function (DUF6166)
VAEVLYSGQHNGRVIVRESGIRRPLDSRFDLSVHFPSGFGSGKSDDGWAQLSLALLADALGDDSRALWLHHAFNSRVVAIFPDRWTITRSRILAHVNMIEHQAGESDPAPTAGSMMVAAQGEFAAASSQIKSPASSSANRAGWGEPLGEVG